MPPPVRMAMSEVELRRVYEALAELAPDDRERARLESALVTRQALVKRFYARPTDDWRAAREAFERKADKLIRLSAVAGALSPLAWMDRRESELDRLLERHGV